MIRHGCHLAHARSRKAIEALDDGERAAALELAAQPYFRRFRRQVPVGCYVLDLYCPALRLAIEVDGQHHETPWMGEYDDERTRYLQSQGIDVVRITNKLLATDSLSAERVLEHAIATRCAGS